MKAKYWFGIALMILGFVFYSQLNSVSPVSCVGFNVINPLCWINQGMFILAKMLAIVLLVAGILLGLAVMFLSKNNWKTLTAAIILAVLTIVLIIATPGIPDEYFSGALSLLIGYFGLTKKDNEVLQF